MKRRILTLVLIAVVAAGVLPTPAAAAEEAPLSAWDTRAGVLRYDDYRTQYASELPGESVITLSGESGVSKNEFARIIRDEDYHGGAALVTAEGSDVVWRFEVSASGLYQIMLRVSTGAEKNASARRAIHLNGSLPFAEAQELIFYRKWKDETADRQFAKDKMGNELRPDASLVAEMHDEILTSAYGTPYVFYLEAGKNELRLTGLKEQLIIDEIRVLPHRPLPTYEQVKKDYEERNLKIVENRQVFIEAENTSAKSDYTVYPTFDRTSPGTTPNSTGALLLNVIGGSNWQYNGQWIEWTADIPESGLYQITLRYKQSSLQGVPVMRSLYIDGKIPFSEAAGLRFPYGDRWQILTLSDEENEPYLFHFEKGKRVIRLRAVTGELSPIIARAKESLESLNGSYRDILSVAGVNPDVNRDYDFEKIMPEVLESLRLRSEDLKGIAKDLFEITQQKGEMFSVLETLIDQLDLMVEKPYEIARQFPAFKTNLSALGNWVYRMGNQPLMLDSLTLSDGNHGYDAKADGFFPQLWFNIKLFFGSFLPDYNTGMSGEDSPEVWVPTGRDQWQIISTMADNDFTKKTGIPVSVKLVAPTALLPSVLAGRGPDVALSNAQNIPVDYALRNAAHSLSGFEGIDEILGRFHESATVPFYYNGELYGLPENQTWPMLFVRNDILTEMKLGVPETWEELISAIPVIKRRNMEFGMIVGYQGFLHLLYQNGGSLYREGDVVRTGLDSNEAIAAFSMLCNLFTQYKLPIEYDAANRFRSGEMPMVIADYAFYNQLTVFAPEIRGLWAMYPIPGVRREDGTVNRTAVSTTTAAIMIQNTKREKEAFEFLKWLTCAETQSSFGTEMEAVMGPSAKQPTANPEAMERLSWSTAEFEALRRQQNNNTGIPVYPGYYQAERLVGFAFNNVYKSNLNPAEKLEDTILAINAELKRRQEELFSLKD